MSKSSVAYLHNQRNEKTELGDHPAWRYVSKYLNEDIEKLSKISIGSNRKIIWFCDALHISEDSIRDHTIKNRKCSVCSGYGLPLRGFNDIFTINPQLEYLWDFSKNALDPTTLKKGSPIKAWWKCPLGHSFKRHANEMTASKIPISESYSGCSICSNRRLLIGFNDLATVKPDIAKEWDYDKNHLRPEEVMGGYQKPVYWLCSKNGHSWKSAPNSRNNASRGCPYCTYQKLLVGFNDSKTLYPELEKLWSKKNQLNLSQVLGKGADKKFWWDCDTCDKGWMTKIARVLMDVRCSNCFPRSKLEEMVVSELYKLTSSNIVVNNRPLKDPTGKMKYLELDIWIPELKLAFEVQDFSTHSLDRDDEEMSEYWGTMTGDKFKRGPSYHEIKRQAAKVQLNTDLYDLWEDEVRNGRFKDKISSILESRKNE